MYECKYFFFLKKINSDKKHLIKFELNKKEEEICANFLTNYFNNFENFKKHSISVSAFETTKILLLKNIYSVISINLFLNKFSNFIISLKIN